MSRRRNVERAVRGGLLRALASVVGSRDAVPAWGDEDRRVLVIRLDAIGDTVLTTGLIAAIRARQPRLTVDVLTLAANAAVLEHNPDVADVVTFKQSRKGRLFGAHGGIRRAGYAAVIDAMVARDSVRSGTVMLMLATGAPALVGLVGRQHDEFYTVRCGPKERGEHHLETLRRLGAPFGVTADDDMRPRLYVSDAERERAEARWHGVQGTGLRVLVNLSVAHARRRWPDDRFAAALAHVRAEAPDACIAVLAMPADVASAASLAQSVAGAPFTTSLRDMLAVVAAADLVFTPDTAIVHVAAAFRTPTVAMLIPGQLAFAPYLTPGASVVSGTDLLTDLPVERVLPALDKGLAAARRSPRAARAG